MLSQELEFCLNDAFAKAREARHEFLTVEHLLLSILDTPKVREILRACGADLARLKDSLNEHLDRTTPRLPNDEDREVQPTLGLPARPAARGVPRAVVGQEGSRRRQRAHRDLQREAEPRGAPAESRRSHAARRGQFRLARPVEDRRREDRQGRGRRRRSRSRRRWRQRARQVHRQPQPARAGRQDRSADRPHARGRAHHRNPVPPPQEQPAVRG